MNRPTGQAAKKGFTKHKCCHPDPKTARPPKQIAIIMMAHEATKVAPAPAELEESSWKGRDSPEARRAQQPPPGPGNFKSTSKEDSKEDERQLEKTFRLPGFAEYKWHAALRSEVVDFSAAAWSNVSNVRTILQQVFQEKPFSSLENTEHHTNAKNHSEPRQISPPPP